MGGLLLLTAPSFHILMKLRIFTYPNSEGIAAFPCSSTAHAPSLGWHALLLLLLLSAVLTCTQKELQTAKAPALTYRLPKPQHSHTDYHGPRTHIQTAKASALTYRLPRPQHTHTDCSGPSTCIQTAHAPAHTYRLPRPHHPHADCPVGLQARLYLQAGLYLSELVQGLQSGSLAHVAMQLSSGRQAG